VNDQDAKIRRLLGEMADEVPPHDNVPPSMVRRARTRIAMNSVVIGVMIVALGAGVFGGVRALTRSPKQTPAPFLGTSSTPTPVGTPSCTAGQLRAIGSMSGAAGSRIGDIELRNYSNIACTLRGRPTIKLYDGTGRPIVSGVTYVATAPQWQADGRSAPAGWPVVTLPAMGGAKGVALVRIRWSNWCPQRRAFPLWRVSIPGSGTVDVVNGMETAGAPPCNGPGQPSTIEVGPFEP